MIDGLSFGDSHAGLLSDGVDGTPYAGATLRMDDRSGVEVEISYIPHDRAEQFNHVHEWFTTRTPPLNMVFQTPNGPVTLFGNRWRGHTERSGLGISSGRIRPDETLLGHLQQPLSAPLLVTRAWSVIDGLNQWTRGTSISSESRTNDEGLVQAVDITVETAVIAHWVQDDAMMRLRGDWGVSHTRNAAFRSTQISDQVVVESEFKEPRPFFDHLQEHRKLANLLAFIYDHPTPFRAHKVAGNGIPPAGRLLISSRTIREYGRPVPESNEFNFPLASFGEIGAQGLEGWATKYDAFARFILPTAAAFGRDGLFLEDIILSTSMGIEAAGGLLGYQQGEEATYSRGGKPTTATYAYRCLSFLAIGWGARVYSVTGLARAMANNYNTVKHFDRGDFPDHAETLVISQVNRLVVRLLALRLTGGAEHVVAQFTTPSYRNKALELMELNSLRIVDDAGTWEVDGV
ncbi:hypothetical protein [Microbacterium enclense]|uniref:ApeA N-terminal domain 1-containing protein n=1 Tax=Microbacterium enclense TaxID=993073 RepID=UPI003F817C78